MKEIAKKFGVTEREFDIWELIAQGFNNEEIAQKLAISILTVRSHIAQLYSKLFFQDTSKHKGASRVKATLAFQNLQKVKNLTS